MKYKFRCFQLSVFALVSRVTLSLICFFRIRHLNFLWIQEKSACTFSFAAPTQVKTSCEIFFRVKVDNSLSLCYHVEVDIIFLLQHTYVSHLTKNVQTIQKNTLMQKTTIPLRSVNRLFYSDRRWHKWLTLERHSLTS